MVHNSVDLLSSCRVSEITLNNRGYGHLAVSIARNVPFREHSLSWNDKVNAVAKLSACTACPDLSGSASQ